MGNTNIRCSQCGLVNFATATECRRCRSPLSAGTGDGTAFNPTSPNFVSEKFRPETTTLGLPDYKTAVPMVAALEHQHGLPPHRLVSLPSTHPLVLSQPAHR